MKTYMWWVLLGICALGLVFIFWRLTGSKVEAPVRNMATSTETNLPDTGTTIPQGMDKG